MMNVQKMKFYVNTQMNKLNQLIKSNNVYLIYSSISNAQHIKKWIFIRGDFTVDGGELTPTLKLKRNVATEKN